MADPADPVRADRWLWAARFFKTRALAVEAIGAGHVQRDGKPLKPSRLVGPGDELTITVGQQRFRVVVRATAQRRGPASEAVRLYEESAESRAERERLAEQRRLAAPLGADLGRRPTKRDRRRMEQERGRLGG
ncbi:Ribosome-associated heat shock protein [Patulibacter medicamentivorans]|jgi:ribosome-associated heat shock protein Hsp15|uniref:Ribosome-associated heat shock protein n=1 Tax=Patulibacter medicamentivorans TaxID=1097667 RepID=H0E710_9ACTN|nr:S4 domain-containing protein [Patulibacter medicamentivorans]EHN10505.1 Ribosome-associated heat shock protein [Patulibacter medicamentivorans]